MRQTFDLRVAASNSGTLIISIFAIIVLSLAASMSPSLFAQTTVDGAFRGVIKDAETGNPVPGAKVIFRSRDTGQEVVSTTGNDGTFTREHLTSGEYEVEITAPGYDASGPLVKKLYTGDYYPVDPIPFPLKKTASQIAVVPVPPIVPGQPTPTAASTPVAPQAINTGGESERIALNAKRGGIFNRDLVSTLPLGSKTLTRSFDELALLVPGVTLPPLTIGNGSGPGQGPGVGSAGQFSVNGMRSRSNNFTVDGSDNNDEDIGVRRQGFFSLVPQPIESIQEYQITTLLAPAQFGRNIGAQVNAVSKTGGNDFHGAVYGFFNSRQLNATNAFDYTGPNKTMALTGRTLGGETKNVYFGDNPASVTNGAGEEDKFNLAQGGFVLGGPIVRSETGRESHSLYFFVSAEAQRLTATKETSFSVPTVAQRGVFGTGAQGLVNGNGDPVFPTRIMGSAIFSLFPFPNDPTGVYGENTLTQLLPADARGLIASGKLDWNFKAFDRAQQLVTRYNFTDDRRDLPVTGGAIFSSLEPKVRTQNLSVFLNTPQLSANSSNQLRLSYGRTHLNFREVRDPSLLSSEQVSDSTFLLNSPLLINGTLTGFVNPNCGSRVNIVCYQTGGTTESVTGPLGQVNIAGYSPIGVDVFNFPQQRTNNTYQIADTVSVRRGEHIFTFGGDTRRAQLASDLPRNSRPLATFGGTQVSTLGFNFSPTDLAAGGAPTGFFTTLATGGSGIDLRYNQLDFFAQADIHISRHLLVSAGIRYEYNTVPHEHNNLIEKTFNSPALDLLPDLKTFIGGRTQIYEPDRNNFGPRIGIAYSHERSDGTQTVLRAGYGLYYDQILGAVVSQSRNVYPTFLTLNTAGGAFQGNQVRDFLLFNPAYSLSNTNCATLNGICYTIPGTLNTLNAPFTDVVTFNRDNRVGGFSITLPERNLKIPMAHQYHVTLEQEVLRGTFISVAYVGTLGRNLLRLTTPNLGPNVILVPTSATGSAFGEPIIQGTVFAPGADFHRPLPTAGSVNIYRSNGTSSYNSLQLQARGRFRNWLDYTASYTYSHSKDDASDVFDLAGAPALPQSSCRDLVELTGTSNLPINCPSSSSEYAPSNFDVRHRFSYYVTYEIPGRNNGSRVYRAIFGGMQLVSSGYFQSGQPFTVNSIFDVNLDGNLTDRLNSTNGITITGSHRQPIILDPSIDTSTLLAPLGQDGAIRRNSFLAGNLLNLDFALVKNFAIREDQRIVFRMDIFNFINRANYGIPVRFLEAPGFGQATDTVTPGRRIQFGLKYIF